MLPKPRLSIPLALALAGVAASASTAASARPIRHHRAHAVRVSMPRPPVPQPALAGRPAFYPNDIEGGVHANLPFNNQIRKLTDPLNANGGGG